MRSNRNHGRSGCLTSTTFRRWRFATFATLAIVGLFVATPFLRVELAQKSQTPPTTKPAVQRKDSAGSQDTKRDLSWGVDKPADPTVPAYKAETQAYALIIGISSYGNLPQSAQLKFADADAQELQEFLIGEKGGFRPENVTLLVNEQAGHEQILRELAKIQNLSGPDSIALIFFAGHGLVNKSGQAFLVAADTKLDDLLNTGIDMKLFNSTVQSMRSRSAIIISDACHSGTLGDLLGQSGTNSIANLSVKAFAEPGGRRDQSSFIFSAASPTQASLERGSLRHGVFTYYMLQGLDGPADIDANGIVTSSELYSFVSAKIRDDGDIPGIKQVPEYNPSYDRSIPLAIVKDEGRTRYRNWFSEDPFVTRWVAALDESLKENRLTRPQGQSAWDYYLALSNFGPSSSAIAMQKREELLARIRTEADKVIERLPVDSGPWDEARENLDKAYQLTHDDSFKARQLFASVMYFHSTGDTARAERECDNTLSLIEESSSRNPLLSVRLGQFYAGLKKWDKARRAYRLVMDQSPTVAWTTEYADVLLHLGLYSEAEEHLRRAHSSNPDYQPLLILLARVLLQNPQAERVLEARRLVARARSVAPDDPDTEELWGRILLATGESKLAIDSLSHVAGRRAAGEKRDQSLLYLSDAFASVGDLDRAISALREAELGGSRNVAIYDALAARLDEQGALDKALVVAQKAVDLTKGQAEENARRVRLTAEYLERGGQLLEAAYKFREASRLTTDGKLSTSLESHARVLFLRSNRTSEVGPVLAMRNPDRSNTVRSTSLIIPGGLDALKYLTGVASDEADPVMLARVFAACLRDPAVNSRVLSFYEDYPELARRATLRGSSLSGTLDLPGMTQSASSDGREALKFFGLSDKNGRREVKTQFQARQHILEALGGDAAKVQAGEPARLSLQNGEIPVLRGMEWWTGLIKDGLKARPEEQFLAFLQDPQAMKIYVAFSVLPDEAIAQFGAQILTKDKIDFLPATLSFATPYLRFTPEGNLDIPGQRQGEINWARALKLNSSMPLVRALFMKESGGALYLFCALSASGEVGDFISRSAGFEPIFRLVEKSMLPSQRKPFDLIDFMQLLHVRNEQLHLSKAGEAWMKSTGANDPVATALATVARSAPGQEVLLVKQLAVLEQIERERPDWTADASLLTLIATQTSANHEAELEVALDLRLTPRQLTSYYSLVTSLDSLPASPARAAAIRCFQSSFALLRQVARNGSQPQVRIAELVDKLLAVDPLSKEYGPRVVSFFRQDLLGLDATLSGADVDAKLIESLTVARQVGLPSAATDVKAQFDFAAYRQDQMKRFMAVQKYTHFAAVVDAVSALGKLQANPSAGDELAKLKLAAETFVEPVPEPDPKKKKSKQPVVVEPTLKELIARISTPVASSALDQVRTRLTAATGEGLLGYVYATFVDSQAGTNLNNDLVRNHDFAIAPWRDAKIENGKLSGGVARLSRVLGEAQVRGIGAANNLAFATAMLDSAQLVDNRLVTRRGAEYVARTIDLGEEVLALSFLADQTAASVMNQVDNFVTARRAGEIKSAVERGEIAKAIRMTSPSEFYTLGQAYFNRRVASTPASQFVDEPGAFGAIARIIDASKSAKDAVLADEVRQFGMPATTRTGLARLDLLEPEPYERCLSFVDDDRLAERIQDLKLASIRRSFRNGSDPMLALNTVAVLNLTEGLLADMKKQARGANPPAGDWTSIVNVLQRPDDGNLTTAMLQVSKSAFVRTTPRSKWDQR